MFGPPRIGVLNTLNASERNWELTRSVKLKRLFNDMSHCGRHGLRSTLLRNGMVCSVFGPRIAHAGLEHEVKAGPRGVRLHRRAVQLLHAGIEVLVEIRARRASDRRSG